MAPLSQLLVRSIAVVEDLSIIKGRAEGSKSNPVNNFSPHQVFLQQCLAMAAASISVVAGLVSFYWFKHIRTSFRHHLIFLLIACDMFKSVWYLISAAVNMDSGQMDSKSPFCQGAGTLVAFGVESSDFAILVIAVHAALCIFKPRTSLGESGLYTYRYLVYFFWVALPAFVAALPLAFRNNGGGYMNQGTYCYLPAIPFWYRIVLSWIPRYVILIFIAGLYLAIYLYVRYKFDRFDFSKGDSHKKPSENTDSHVKSTDGQLDGANSRSSMPTTATEPSLKSPVPVAGNLRKESDAPAWENYTFGSSTPIAQLPPDQITDIPMEPLHSPSRHDSDDTSMTRSSREDTRAMIEALRNSGPDLEGAAQEKPGAPLRLVDSHNQPVTASAMKSRHTAIKRQLRFLFIYPVVYLFVWIIPFVQHCLLYNAAYRQNPNFVLNCFSVCLLNFQCLIDSCLFSFREKPWRHVGKENNEPGTHTSFLASFAFWRHGRRNAIERTDSTEPAGEAPSRPLSAILLRGQSERGNSGMARPKGERVAEARAARERRHAEQAHARAQNEDTQRKRKLSFARRGGGDRSWWEVEGKKRKDSVLLGTDPAEDVSRKDSEATLMGVEISRVRTDGAAHGVNEMATVKEDEG